VEISGLDRAEELAGGDTTYASFAGTSGVWNTSGSNTRTFTDLGAGNDRFICHGSDDTVTGGEGDDLACGGDGHDTWVLGGAKDGYELVFANNRWLITDTDLTDGNDGRDDIGGFEAVRFGDGSSMSLLPVQQGLVLWNRLGSATETTNSEVGPDGTLVGGSFVPGVFGQAWRAEPEDATGFLDTTTSGLSFPSSVINTAAGTIEFWARFEGFGAFVNLQPCPGLMTTVPTPYPGQVPPGKWNIGFSSNDGLGNGGLVGQVGQGIATGSGTYAYTQVPGDDVAGWHHYAISWSEHGFATLGQPMREVMLFVDGAVASRNWYEAVNTEVLAAPFGEAFVLGFDNGPGKGWPDGSAVEFDNLKVWDVAKTDFADRFIEDSGFTLIA
jgi:hypothetical protein